MALDMIVLSCSGENVFHIEYGLHSVIFDSQIYNWKKTIFLKKAYDYYEDCFFYADEAIIFLKELYDACVKNGVDVEKELKGVKVLLERNNIKEIKLLAD